MALLLIQRGFDRTHDGTMHAQLYRLIRRLVFEGDLPGATRLPSSRALATALGISRHTVSTAIDLLLAEGYLEGRVGSGTYVSEHFTRPRSSPARPATAPVSLTSSRGRTMADSRRSPFSDDAAASGTPRAFRVGLPAVDVFPERAWWSALADAWYDVAPGRLGYQHPCGLEALREWVTSYLGASRGLVCKPEQVVIVSGSQGGLDLCFRVLLDPGDVLAMEDPGYLGARSAAEAAGLAVEPVPVDADGIDVGFLRRSASRPRAVFVTPTHQFPLGVPLNLERRLDVIGWAVESGAWIIEDDYDSEYRYGGRPFDPLAALDRADRVIYIGTFSKVLFPSLRLGYLVLPPGLVETFEAAHLSADIHRPVLEQAALVRFMEAGHFSRHLRRTQEVHAERRAGLLAEAAHGLAGELDLHPAQAGLHLFGSLPPGADDVEIARLAGERGVEVWPLSIHSRRDTRKGLLLGYGGVPPGLIAAGVDVLAAILADSRGQQP